MCFMLEGQKPHQQRLQSGSRDTIFMSRFMSPNFVLAQINELLNSLLTLIVRFTIKGGEYREMIKTLQAKN